MDIDDDDADGDGAFDSTMSMSAAISEILSPVALTAASDSVAGKGDAFEGRASDVIAPRPPSAVLESAAARGSIFFGAKDRAASALPAPGPYGTSFGSRSGLENSALPRPTGTRPLLHAVLIELLVAVDAALVHSAKGQRFGRWLAR